MDYSKETLQKIQQLAQELTPISEISFLLDCDEVQLTDDVRTPGSADRKAYMTGYAKAAHEIRMRNMDLSKAGSPAADEALRGYLKKMMNDL